MSFPEETFEEKRPRFRVPGIQILTLILPLIMLLFFLPTGVYMERPGDALGVEDRITIKDVQTYQNPGTLMLTTVSLTSTSVLEMTVALFGDSKLESETTVIGPNPDPGQNNQLEEQMISDSKQEAAAAALIHLGYDVTITQEGVLVDGIVAGYPADGKLMAGDLITSVNGQPALNTATLKSLVAAAGVGATLILHVNRGGQEFDVTLTTVENPGVPGEALIGIGDQDKVAIDLPFPVTIDTGGIGGPSAGTMMALSIIDVLTPGGIAGGKTIAGTGTIDVQGNVGAIGGIDFKIAAAESAGAVAFIYPADNDSDINKAKAKIPLYPVRTLDEALQAVHTIATTP